MRASELRFFLAFSHSKTAISFNVLLVLQKLCRYKWWYLSAYMYRQVSKCTDKTPKKHYWGGGGGQLPPLSGYASATNVSACTKFNFMNTLEYYRTWCAHTHTFCFSNIYYGFVLYSMTDTIWHHIHLYIHTILFFLLIDIINCTTLKQSQT